MNNIPLVSIIINNYNYSRFLKEAIDSALNQTYSNKEIIVVDDGSTDNSPEIIDSYSDNIIAILKQNGGQASAFNAGFISSTGAIILFLDSDDKLLPEAASKTAEAFISENISKVHWQLFEMDECGRENGKVFPDGDLAEGNLQKLMIIRGPDAYNSPPTTGNAWSRSFLSKIFPIPEEEYKISADLYLYMLAPVFGLIKAIKQPLGFYRIHGSNNFKGKILEEKTLTSLAKRYEYSCQLLQHFISELGITADPGIWKKNSWLYKLSQSVSDIKSIIPPNNNFILVDEDQWEANGDLEGRKVIPFPEQNGRYWGPPADTETAIYEIERQRKKGASSIFFTWISFWWLDYYIGLLNYLKNNYECILKNERIIGFSLSKIDASN